MDSVSLNKYIANTGVCSRRAADKWIEEGVVTINGKVATKGNRVVQGDEVLIKGKPLHSKPKPVYLAFHKPPGITCTTDLRDKSNIISFINYPKRIFPIGRLDKASSGLILLTNDGDVVNKVLRKENGHQKEYIVTVNRSISQKFIKDMSNGVPILGTKTLKCKVSKIRKDTFKIILTQGLNRQIRRMCEFYDYKVVTLKRVRIMHINLEGIAKGKFRNLTDQEVSKLLA